MSVVSDQFFTLIVNPVSGKRNGLIQANRIYEQLQKKNIRCDLRVSEYAGHVKVLVNVALDKQCIHFIIVGGDGTINECINAFCSHATFVPGRIAFTVLPLGTGNDFATHMKLRKDIDSIIRRIVSHTFTVHDAARVSSLSGDGKEKYFLNMSGFGFDGIVAQTANRLKRKGYRGLWVYYVALCKHLFTHKSSQLQVVVKGQPSMDMKLFTGAVGIGKHNGGGMIQCPDALHHDGLLDITLITHMSVAEIIWNISRLFNGTIYSHPKVKFIRCASLELYSHDTVLIETDGEDFTCLPSRIDVIPQAFRVWID